MKVTNNIYYVGSDDFSHKLFENIHPIDEGVSYNSYLLLDDKNVLFDTADSSVSENFLKNVSNVLGDKTLDFLVIHHMEPDHCSCIGDIISRYPNIKIISTKIASVYMKQFGFDVDENLDIVSDGDIRNFGNHEFKFITAPLVHWPEVMVSYEKNTKTLFSADAFGTFGALNGKMFLDQFENQQHQIDEYRRYYGNIVGKFGPQVQSLIKKLSDCDIQMICPLHGPAIRENLDLLLQKYDTWSCYNHENDGVLIVYSSMYGNTKKAVEIFAKMLEEQNINYEAFDVSTTHISYLVAKTFEYKTIVLGAVTYNTGLFPLMHNYLEDIKSLNLQNKKIGIIENGTWAVVAAKKIKDIVGEMKNIDIFDNIITIKSTVNEDNTNKMKLLCDEVALSSK